MMLVLTRYPGETIKIGDNITLVIKEVRGKQVRVGIIAPREVEIWRDDVNRREDDE